MLFVVFDLLPLTVCINCDFYIDCYYSPWSLFLQYLDVVGWQPEGHSAWKKWVVVYWHGYLFRARCKVGYGL